MAPTWGHSSKGNTMTARKTPGRKAPAKKVASIQRHREHKAKKAKLPPHVIEDVPPVQPEFDFTALGDARLKQANPVPEPGPVLSDKGQCYRPEYPQYEGRDNTIPSSIQIDLGRCHISVQFR